MPFNVRCWMQPTAALAAATILLTACAGAGFDARPGACPPVVEYSRAEQVRVAVELAALPDGATIIEWLADYAVLRDQARSVPAKEFYRPDRKAGNQSTDDQWSKRPT